MYKLFICLFFSLISFATQAQFVFDVSCKTAYQELLALRLDNANFYAQKSLLKSPNNGIAHYIKNYIKTIKVFINDDQAEYQLLQKAEDDYYELLENNTVDSPYKNFLIAESKLQLAFLKLKFGNEISGAIDLRSAYKLLIENQKKYPTFKPHLKSIGLLHVLIGSIPSNYKWVTDVAGMSGTVSQGLKEIQQCVIDKNDFSFEAQLYQYLINIYVQKQQVETIPNLENLYALHPDNLTLSLVLASTLLHNQQSEKAKKILESRPQSKEYTDVSILHKMLGDCYFYASDYTNATKEYVVFMQKYKGQNYKKDVYYKYLLMEWFQKNTLNETYISKVKTIGKAIFEVDKHALRYTNEIKLQNKKLTQIRVLYDGGYFDKAFEMLNAINIKEFKKKVHLQEYYYRMGRVCASLNKFNEAILAYKKAIANHDAVTNAYYAPNACLQLGYIYIDRYDKVNAKKYFVSAIETYSGHDYETSIETKAKIALATLK